MKKHSGRKIQDLATVVRVIIIIIALFLAGIVMSLMKRIGVDGLGTWLGVIILCIGCFWLGLLAVFCTASAKL